LGEGLRARAKVKCTRTDNGIFLPASVQEKPQVGEITAISSGKFSKNGSGQQADVKVGDNILYSMYRGTEIYLGNERM